MKAGFPLSWIALTCCVWSLEAQPIVYQTSGTREQVKAAVNQFEHDIVYGPTGDAQQPPMNLGSYRVATLDDIPVGAPSPVQSGGLVLVDLPGVGLHVLDNGESSFSPPNSLAITTLLASGFDSFVVQYPNFADEFHQNAFGAVFANAPSGFAALAISYVDNTSNGFEALPADSPGQFSFIGVINPQANINHALVYMKAASSNPPPTDAPLVDEIILGAAVPLPEPGGIELFAAAGIVAGAMRGFHLARARRQEH